MGGFLLEAGALGLPAVRVRLVGGREEGVAQDVGEFCGLDGAIRRDQRPGVCEPGPGLPGEGDVGIERQGLARPVRELDAQAHADRIRPWERLDGRTGTIGRCLVVRERTNLAVVRDL